MTSKVQHNGNIKTYFKFKTYLMLVNFVYGGRFGIKTITAIRIVEYNITFNIIFINANKNPIMALEQSPMIPKRYD